MTVKELKEAIANLPDDMEVCIDIDYEIVPPLDGIGTKRIDIDMANDILWLTANFD